MKKITTLLLLCFFGLNIYSQITYYDTDFAGPLDSFLVSKANETDLNGYDFSVTGTNYTWDFSALGVTTQNYKKYINPNFSGYKAVWVTNCIAGGGSGVGCNNSWNDTTNLASFNQDSIVLGSISLSDVAYFYKKNANVLENSFYGYTIKINGIDIKKIINYSNADTIYHFPLQYLNTDSAVMEYVTDLTSVGIDMVSKKYQKRVNFVDGWGSLITPYGTFSDVIRLKTLVYHQDTTYSFGTMLPVNASVDIIYSWFDANYGIPVLTVKGKVISGNETYTSANYIDTLRCLQPSAHFAYNPIVPIIDGSGNADVNFINLSTNADNFSWNFGDGGTSTSYNPSHTYNGAGTYPVTLIVENSVCSPATYDTITIPIIVQDTSQVVANFTYSPYNTCLGDTTFFNNISYNSTNFNWDFGDNTTSTDENPYHIYSSIGDYNVRLIASDGSQYDTITKTVSIISAEIDAGNNITINSGDTAFLNATGTGYGYFIWNYDTTLSCITCSNPYATPTVSTTYYVSKTNSCGMGNDSVTVFVNPLNTTNLAHNDKIFVYPNPTKGFINIKINGNNNQNSLIELYGIDGRVLIHKTIKNKTTINIDNYNKGVYILKIRQSNNLIYYYKIIKQ